MQYKNSLSVCPYCGVGCNFYLQVMDNELVGVLPDKNHEISRGKLCIKGMHANEFVTSEERLTKPLIRSNGSLRECSWGEALDLVAKKLKGYQPEQLGILTSAKCTNEENYVLQKFARAVLGTNNIDHCARL